MKKYLLTLFAVMSSMTVFGQETATTEEGKKVVLHPNGTWEYVADSKGEETTEATRTEETTTIEVPQEEEAVPNEVEVRRPTSSIFIGSKRLTAGVKTNIHQEDYGLTTSVSVAKEGERTLVIFWQESTDKDMNFFNWLWIGTVLLYLDNGTTITLTDRNMHGQNKITDGKTGSYGSKSDLYQRFSAHYLTPSECQQLKRSGIAQVAYRTTSSFEQGTTYIEASENKDALQEQLLAIGR